MKLRDLALLAEVVSGVAIVVSLIILIVEVRASTGLARVAAYNSVTRDFDLDRELWLSDPELFDLFYGFTRGDLPDWDSAPEAAFKLTLLLLDSLAGHERAYLSYRAEIFGENEWQRIESSQCSYWIPARDHDDDRYLGVLTRRLTSDYVDHLNSSCE